MSRLRRVVVLLVSGLCALGFAVVPGSASAAGRSANDDASRFVALPGWATIVSEKGWGPGDGGDQLFTAPRYQMEVETETDAGRRLVIAAAADSGALPSFEFDDYAQGLHEGTYTDVGPSSDAETDRATGMSLDEDGGSYECGGVSGGFTVHDLAPDLSRVWITYDLHCPGVGTSITGEIRLGEPAEPGFDTAPTQVHWPAVQAGHGGRLTPVTVLAPSGSAVTVRSARVTSGVRDFGVAYSTCGIVVAGGFCVVYVRFTPTATGLRTGRLTLATSVGTRVVPLDGTGSPTATRVDADTPDPEGAPTLWASYDVPADPTPTSTRLTFVSERGDNFLNGGSDTQGLSDYQTVEGSDMRLQVVAHYWVLDVDAASDQLLLPGTTVTSTEAGTVGGPGRSGGIGVLRGDYASGPVGKLVGQYTVTSASYDRYGDLTSIALAFRAHQSGCNEIRGVFAWNAPPPAVPAPLPVLSSRITLRTAAVQHTRHAFVVRGRLSPVIDHLPQQVMLERRLPRRYGYRWRSIRDVLTDGDGRFATRVSWGKPGLLRIGFLAVNREHGSHSRRIRVV